MPSVELDDGHGEGDGHKRDDQVLQHGKEEREKQNQGDQGKGIK